MKYSRYNIFSKIRDSENFFIINLLTGNADILNPDEAKKVEALKNGSPIENIKTKVRQKLFSDEVFIFIGMKPNIQLFKDKLELDRWGYIKTDDEMRTSVPGVYAVGDVISKKYRQITTAVADGTIAAMAISKEIDL